MDAASPITTLYHALMTDPPEPLPFEWMVAWASDATLDRAWRAEADATWPTPGYMLGVLTQLRRRGDTRVQTAVAAVAEAELAAIREQTERKLREIDQKGWAATSARRARAFVERSARLWARRIGTAAKAAVRAPTRAHVGDFVIALQHSFEPSAIDDATKQQIRRRAATTIAAVVPAPTVAEVVALLTKRTR